MNIPRPEYPRPQFVREDWLCLNGTWQFEIDAGDTGLERGLLERPLAQQIVVPFCPESVLSGIGNIDFMPAVWYRRKLVIPPECRGEIGQRESAGSHNQLGLWRRPDLGGGFLPALCCCVRSAA